MYPHFTSFIGSSMFLSEKDSHPLENEGTFVTSRSPMRHVVEDVSQNFDDPKNKNDHHEGNEKIESEVLVSPVNLKLPAGKFDYEEEEEKEKEDGCKTPTSEEHKIPLTICPPAAPRKSKWLLPATSKRKGSGGRVFLDVSREIEALFPPAILADCGNKIKKVRKENIII